VAEVVTVVVKAAEAVAAATDKVAAAAVAAMAANLQVVPVDTVAKAVAEAKAVMEVPVAEAKAAMVALLVVLSNLAVLADTAYNNLPVVMVANNSKRKLRTKFSISL